MGLQGRLASILGSGGSELRKAGRVRCQHITCSLGEVADLSASGMRVLCKNNPHIEPNQAICFYLHSLEGKDTPVTAEVAWSRKVGWRKHELGVRFLDVLPELRMALLQLCRASAYNETFSVDARRAS